MATNEERRSILKIRDTRILFPNFEGREQKFNREGDRNFCVVIPDADVVEKLEEDGWNVKTLQARNEDDEPVHYIRVKVSYKYRAPKVFVLLEGGKKISLSETNINELDNLYITNVDKVSITPSRWTRDNGESGITGYLKSIYVTLDEDDEEELVDFYKSDITTNDEIDEDSPF